MNIPRVVVAGVTSGVGKTTISIGIMHALRNKGLKVQPFKVGPDYIDPSYHELVSGKASRNLDVWMMGKKGLLESFSRACTNADIAVIEGVMGLFDGMSGRNNFASTAHVAQILKSPVILIVDCSKAARSIAAIVLGFLRFDKRVAIAGLILNNVASDRHEEYLVEALADKVKVPILGIIRRNRDAKFEERHLGLVPAQELESKRRKQLIYSASEVSAHIDSDKVLGVCSTKPLIIAPTPSRPKKNVVKIAVALDESFNFYYQDNLDALRRAGALIQFFSPVNDPQLPAGTQGIFLGGGFPEVLADSLEKNKSMMSSIRKQIEQGIPAYCECGGLMYLTRSIRGYKGSERKTRMIGIIDAETVMTGRLTLNYTDAVCDGPLLGKVLLRGHEFHYSQLEAIGSDTKYAYSLSKGKGIASGKDGIILSGTGIASYTHLHFAAKGLADKIVGACVAHSRR